MAKNTSTAKPFTPGETNSRAVRPAGQGAGETSVAQTPQRDALSGADTTDRGPADTTAADTGTGAGQNADQAASGTSKAATTRAPKPATTTRAAKSATTRASKSAAKTSAGKRARK